MNPEIKFDALLRAMLTKAPKPLEKTASKRPSSIEVNGEGYGDIQIRKGKSASVSLKPKYEFPLLNAGRAPKRTRLS